MQSSAKNKLSELQNIISKMSLEMCCVTVLPEFGVRWRDVSRAVRNARLPMVPGSIARVLCKHIAKASTFDDLDGIVARLRLTLVASQTRTWHVINLVDPISEDTSPMELARLAPVRIMDALQKTRKAMTPEVEMVMLDNLMYLSVQLVSGAKEGTVLYAATPPGEAVALVSSLSMAVLIRACVCGLGFKRYENANLHGRDINSLLRINNAAWTANADNLTQITEYTPTPVVTGTGIDYTNKSYDVNYVNNLIGPNPPLLTDLSIKSTKAFFDRNMLDKTLNLSIQLKSKDVAQTLKTWVSKGALAPTSDFFQIFHQIKSNKIVYNREDSD